MKTILKICKDLAYLRYDPTISEKNMEGYSIIIETTIKILIKTFDVPYGVFVGYDEEVLKIRGSKNIKDKRKAFFKLCSIVERLVPVDSYEVMVPIREPVALQNNSNSKQVSKD